MRGAAHHLTLARATDLVGAVTVAFGWALTTRPLWAARAVGLDPAHARVIGLADLGLGTALLGARPRWPWMCVRAGLNVAIALEYDAELRRTAPRRRATKIGAVAMRALAISDATLAAALRASRL
jgi:hypothetical protein